MYISLQSVYMKKKYPIISGMIPNLVAFKMPNIPGKLYVSENGHLGAYEVATGGIRIPQVYFSACPIQSCPKLLTCHLVVAISADHFALEVPIVCLHTVLDVGHLIFSVQTETRDKLLYDYIPYLSFLASPLNDWRRKAKIMLYMRHICSTP